MELRPRNGRRLVLFPLPFQGHLNPMLHLADILHFSGFSISIIHTHFNSPNPADHPNFSFHPIPDGLPPKSGASMEDIIPLLNALNQNCSGPFTSCLSEMLSDASAQPVACLITDTHWHVTQAAADGLEIPRIVLRTSNFTTLAVLAALPLLRQKGYLPLRGNWAAAAKPQPSTQNPSGMELRPRIGRRVVLFPLPFQGHLNPMLHLANILHFSGFSISIIHTRFNSPNPADHPHFSFHPIPDGLPPKSGASMEDIIPLLNALNQNCSGTFTSCLSEMLSDASAQPVACLITDTHWHVTQAAADGLEIPRIVLRTISFTTFAVLAALPLLRQKGYLPLRESQLEEPVHEFPPLKIKDIPRSGTTDDDPMYQLLSTMCKESKASRGIIINSFEELEPSAMSTVQQEFGVPVFPIGPFHKFLPPSPSSLLNPDRTCISWLDAQPPKSVLYVSFGSVASIDEDEFSETAWGLVNSNQPFLWVVRPGLVRGSAGAFQVPDGILDTAAGRACIVEWAPQLEVLSHAATGGFWTHSGWNSTLESLSAGVPMLCRPVLFDQNIDARYVTDVWKVGISIESKLERGKIEEAIKRLMIGREAMEMRERAACLREKADRCLREGGSSCKYLEKLVSLIMSF